MSQGLAIFVVLVMGLGTYFYFAWKRGWGQSKARKKELTRYHPASRRSGKDSFPEPEKSLQVILHDGNPTRTGIKSQLASVRVIARDREVPIFGNVMLSVFRGIVIEDVKELKTVQVNDEILFVVPTRGPHPLLVTEQYLEERPRWSLTTPCRQCGMSELFDPPSGHVARHFPSLTEEEKRRISFTASCGFCGGGMVVRMMRKAAGVER